MSLICIFQQFSLGPIFWVGPFGEAKLNVMSCQVKCTWSSLIVNNCIIFLNPDNVLPTSFWRRAAADNCEEQKRMYAVMAGNWNNHLIGSVRKQNICRKWSYIFTEDISNDRLALHSRPPNPHWLDQLGVGDDQVLPVDEEDWDFLFAQQIGCSDWPNENLGGGLKFKPWKHL